VKAMMEATLTMRPAPSDIIERTTYLVCTIGDSDLPAQARRFENVHQRQSSIVADRSIVDEAE
jgi:hypothetical protein